MAAIRKKEDRDHREKIYWPALFHRVAIRKKEENTGRECYVRICYVGQPSKGCG